MNLSECATRGCGLIEIYRESLIDNGPLPAITDYGSGKTMTYAEVARRIARLHLFFEAAGLKPGDKVALLGKNTSTWICVFMASLTYGTVIVPILHDFNPADAAHIINHSDARVLFVNDSIWEHLDMDMLPELRAVVSLDTRKILAARTRGITTFVKTLSRAFAKRYPDGFGPSDIHYASRPSDDTVILNYTSGTTGFSKGVMLTYDNVAGNVAFGIASRLHYRGSRALSFLPLAHAYGCAFDMLVPLAVGSHVTVLGRTPTPTLLVKAMREVKPNLIICVPLILEKIYRKMIVPMITRKPVRWILALPGLDRAIYGRIRARLVEAFGGEFEEVIIGGAPLNPEVEEFLYRIKFPFTVGYGMTECGPLISYRPWREFEPGSAGSALPVMEARIVPDDTTPGQGEIVVRGQNVMKGYYKNPDATEAALDTDGWLHTGDMGRVGGADGRTIYIRGRYKTMILSANGQNIYPEEIEAKLNNMPYVSESLVVERDGRLVALVYPDHEEMDAARLSYHQLEPIMEDVRAELNKLVAPYEQISRIQVMPEEFKKTPKRSIKRFLYR
ncbi:MAG: AMP-binding protein [Bacteroides sp.]|nr:AMP-binding protein [Bacteroides sp.]MCM1095474.1 AMP-binding protein [Terasakiella sp.]